MLIRISIYKSFLPQIILRITNLKNDKTETHQQTNRKK